METFLQTIEWTPVLVSFVLAYVLGWVWYSPILFVKKWAAGKGAGVVEHPMWMPMAAQAGATFLFAIIVNLATADGDIVHAVLVALTIAGFIKANGLFGGKTYYAITVETVYVLAMAAVMIGVNMWM
jgi:hypothetical protein